MHLLAHLSSKQPRKASVIIPIFPVQETETQKCHSDSSKVTALVGGDAMRQTNRASCSSVHEGILPSLEKTLLNNNSASNRNFLSPSVNETEGGQSGHRKRRGGEEKDGTTCPAEGRRQAAPGSGDPHGGPRRY